MKDCCRCRWIMLLFSWPAFAFSAMRSPAPAGPHNPATNMGAENSEPWRPTHSRPGPDTPEGGQVGTFRISSVPLRLRCLVPDTVPKSRQEQPLPPLYKTPLTPLSQTGTIVAQAAKIGNRFLKGSVGFRRGSPCSQCFQNSVSVQPARTIAFYSMSILIGMSL